jgi:PAS domain S-box-containing protein
MKRHIANAIGAILVLTALYLCRLYSYPLFHSIAEIFSIVVAFGIFMVGWNARKFIKNNYFLFLGVAYPFIGCIDLIHTLSYKGISIFPGYDADLPTQLWISARSMEGLTFAAASFFIHRNLKLPLLILIYSFASTLIFISIFYWDIFPECYRVGEGLTSFKITSEYVIAGLLLISAELLYKNRRDFDPHVLKLLLASIFMTIASELSFTLFTDLYGFYNFIGHYLKMVSFYLIYRAIVETGLKEPYSMLHADLQESQKGLWEAQAKLEQRVEQRTSELQVANKLLRHEIQERERAQYALNESEKLYAILVEGSLLGVYMSQNGKIVFANERFASIFGYPREELTGMPTWKFVHPEDRPQFFKIQQKRQAGEDVPSEYETRGLTRDGRTIWVIRRISLITYKGQPAVLGNIADITKRKKMEHEVRLLSSRILSAEESERKRIAHELHDGIGQLLGAIKFRIESILLMMEGAASNSVSESLRGIVALIQRTIEEIRRILAALRPSILDDLGIIPTINWLCREFRKTYEDVSIEKQIGVKEHDIPEDLKTVIFRVLQESFNNIAKHSRADRIQVSLGKTDGYINLVVEDNGVGFDPAKVLTSQESAGIGLHSIRERSRLSGGVFQINTELGKGTTIRVSWPAKT